MHDRLRVHRDLDIVVGAAEEVVGLDHFKTLVHHRRGVHGDLRAHVPVRVRAGLYFFYFYYVSIFTEKLNIC